MIPPNGCAMCGVEKCGHYRRHTADWGMHQWVAPDNKLRLARMRTNRVERDLPLPEQPDGLDPYDYGLPERGRAAERVGEWLAAYGDGLIDVGHDGSVVRPLYARDLETLRKLADEFDDLERVMMRDQAYALRMTAERDKALAEVNRLRAELEAGLPNSEKRPGTGGFAGEPPL